MYSIIVHGGVADFVPTKLEDEKLYSIMEIAKSKGESILKRGGDCVDAVEIVIKTLEDSGEFNAGRGSVKNRDGNVEMDAAIMKGENQNYGALGCIRRRGNTISMARMAMEETGGIFLVGRGADKILEREEMRRKRELKKKRYTSVHFNLGTVGCVALDQQGKMCAGISSGGGFQKIPGRLGDAAVIGAGITANSDIAVSSSGVGEEFIRHSISNTIYCMMKYGKKSLKAACKAALNLLPHESGGIIALDKHGSTLVVHNCKAFYTVQSSSNKK